MSTNKIRSTAILHFIFIPIITFFYLVNHSDFSFSFPSNQEETKNNLLDKDHIEPQENDNTTFTKEQIEEILVDLLLPIHETIPIPVTTTLLMI